MHPSVDQNKTSDRQSKIWAACRRFLSKIAAMSQMHRASSRKLFIRMRLLSQGSGIKPYLSMITKRFADAARGGAATRLEIHTRTRKRVRRVAWLETTDGAVALTTLIMLPAGAGTHVVQNPMAHMDLDARREVGPRRDEATRQRRTRAGNVDQLRLEGVHVGHVAADGLGPLPFQLIFVEGASEKQRQHGIVPRTLPPD